MHVRSRIRSAVAALLADLPSTGRRVYASRVFSLDEAELPSVSVLTSSEQITRVTMGRPSVYHRTLELVIEGHVIADERIDEALDQIAQEVEEAMAATLSIDGQVLPTQFQGTAIELSGDGESQVGLVRLTYLIPYATREDTPDSLTV